MIEGNRLLGFVFNWWLLLTLRGLFFDNVVVELFSLLLLLPLLDALLSEDHVVCQQTSII